MPKILSLIVSIVLTIAPFCAGLILDRLGRRLFKKKN